MPKRRNSLPLVAGRIRAVQLLVPLALRLITLWELEKSPFFRLLVVDARTYHEMAVAIARGRFTRHEPFWQPPLYPYFLALLYKIGGPHPDLARIAQAILGSIACLVLFELGGRFFGRRAAWIAWGAAAFAGPLIYFDLQMLPASLAVFLLLLGIERLTAPAGRLRHLASGLALGLASVTVATILPVIAIGAVWLLRDRGRRPRRLNLATFLAGALLPVLIVTGSNLAVSGEPVVISYNGGVNLWIGNNPDYDRTVAVRPGRAWIALINSPAAAGVTTPVASSSWWTRRALAWASSHPGAWLRLLLYKIRLLLRGDEIPRNQEIYPFRASSFVLRSLLWIHGIAFPTGILLPWAAAGAYTLFRRRSGRRALPASADRAAASNPGTDVAAGAAGLVLTITIVLSVLVVLFFVTSRYRVTVIPFLILLAAGGTSAWIERARTRDPEEARPGRRWKALAIPALVFLSVGALANTGLPAMPSEFNSDAWSDLGTYDKDHGRAAEAEDAYRTALRLDPANAEAAHNLGVLRLTDGELAGAEALFRQVLAAWPEDASALLNLGTVCYRRQDLYTAGDYYRRAAVADPGLAAAASNLKGISGAAADYERERLVRDPEAFLAELERSYRADPDNLFLFARLTALFVERNLPDRALTIVGLRLRRDPKDDSARAAAVELLRSEGKAEEASRVERGGDF